MAEPFALEEVLQLQAYLAGWKATMLWTTPAVTGVPSPSASSVSVACSAS